MKKLCGLLLAASCALPSGCGVDLENPEAVADAYAQFRIRELGVEMERGLRRMEESIEFEEDKRGLWVGAGTLNQLLDKRRAQYEFISDNIDKITGQIVYDLVDVRDIDASNKKIAIKFWIYEVKTGAKNPKSFYLDYGPKDEWIELTKVGGKWKIQRTSEDRGRQPD